MLWPSFLPRHAKSLNFAHLSFSLRAAFSSLFSLAPCMNAVPDSSRAHPPSRVFPQSLSGFTKWRQSSRISIFRIWIGRSGLRWSVWVAGLQHYRNLQFFWPGDRIIVAATMHSYEMNRYVYPCQILKMKLILTNKICMPTFQLLPQNTEV